MCIVRKYGPHPFISKEKNDWIKVKSCENTWRYLAIHQFILNEDKYGRHLSYMIWVDCLRILVNSEKIA